jgi:hypothetical protein
MEKKILKVCQTHLGLPEVIIQTGLVWNFQNQFGWQKYKQMVVM